MFFWFFMENILFLLWVPSACFLHCVSPFYAAPWVRFPYGTPRPGKTGDSPERRAPRFPRPIGQDPQLITGQISVQVGGEPPHAWCIPAGKSNGTTVTKARRFFTSPCSLTVPSRPEERPEHPGKGAGSSPSRGSHQAVGWDAVKVHPTQIPTGCAAKNPSGGLGDMASRSPLQRGFWVSAAVAGRRVGFHLTDKAERRLTSRTDGARAGIAQFGRAVVL